MDLARIKIEVDTREIKAANDELGSLATKGNKAAKDGIDPIGKSASNAAGKVKLLVGGVVALASATVLKAAISASKEFSASISNLSAITGATGQELEYLKNQAMEIGRTTTLSASQAATAFKLIASAKPDLLESSEALNAVTRSAVTLAEAATIDLTEAANVLGTSLNQFGAGAEEANRFINVLAAGSKFGASSIAEVSEGLKNVGAAANAAGLSFEETNTALQLLAAGGIKGAEAGTGLRNVLLKLEEATETNLRPSVVGLSTALENLASKNMSITETTEMFGREAAIAAQTLVVQSGGAEKLVQALTGTNTALEQATVNTNNLEGDQLALNSAIEASAIAFGQKLEPAMRSLTQFATSAFSSLATNIDAVITAVELLAVVLITRSIPGLYAYITAGGLATSATTAMTAAVTGLRTALAFLGGPAGIAVAVIAVLATLALKARNVEDRMADARAEMDKMNKETLKDAIAAEERYNRQLIIKIEKMQKQSMQVKANQVVMKELTGKLLESNNALRDYNESLVGSESALTDQEGALDAVTPALEEYTGALDDGSGATDTLSETAQEMITDLANQKLQLSMTSLEWDIYNNLLKAGADASPEQRQQIIDTTTSLHNQKTAIQENIDKEKEKTEAYEKELADQKAKYEEWHTSISGFFSDLFTNGKDAFDNLAKSFEKMLADMVAKFLASKIMGYLGKLVGGFGSVGASIGSMLTSGAASAAGGGAGGSILATAGSALGFGAAGAGAGVVGGAGTGIAAAEAAVAAQGAGGTGFLASAGGAIKGGLATVGKGIAAGGKAVMGFAKAALTNPVTAVIGAVLLAGAMMAKKSTPSFNAGLITDLDIPLGKSGQNLGTETFASGLEVMKFGRRSDANEVEANVDVFRTTDAALTGLVTQAGLKVDLDQSDFKGLDERGFANVAGRNFFYGSAGEEGKPGVAIEKQVDSYTKDYFTGLWKDNPDLPRDKLNELLSMGSSEKMIERAALAVERYKSQQADGSHADGLSRVPYDGYVAELHAGERVLTKSQTDSQDAMSADISALRGDIAEIMLAIARNTGKSFRIYDRWDKNGLPPTRAT